MNIPARKLDSQARVCATRGCADTAVGHGGGGGRYCPKHRAITVMRTGSRLAGKYVPSFAEVENLWPADNCCPRCGVKFEFARRKGANYGNHPSIQHFRPAENEPNPLAVVCGRCNHALKNLGDTVEAMSIALGLRKCTHCGELKPEGEFYLTRVRKSGNMRRQSHCMACQKARLREYTKALRASRMTKARALEAEAAQQQITSTRDPRTALAWLKAGKALRIDSLNLRDHLRHLRALVALEGGAK